MPVKPGRHVDPGMICRPFEEVIPRDYHRGNFPNHLITVMLRSDSRLLVNTGMVLAKEMAWSFR